VSANDLPANTKLALDRTLLACERTLMAWVRTAISLITFGFTIYKFFQFERGQTGTQEGLFGPRVFALIMIGIGLTALILATAQHRHSVQALELEGRMPSYSLAQVIAAMVGGLGVLGFGSVLMRL
jgi:putative membrane protein